jgi:uncharacterized membrane protein (UPF0182 family)
MCPQDKSVLQERLTAIVMKVSCIAPNALVNEHEQIKRNVTTQRDDFNSENFKY